MPRQAYAMHMPNNPPQGSVLAACGTHGSSPHRANRRILTETALRSPLSGLAGCHTTQSAVQLHH